jgi:hypothetical protein
LKLATVVTTQQLTRCLCHFHPEQGAAADGHCVKSIYGAQPYSQHGFDINNGPGSDAKLLCDSLGVWCRKPLTQSDSTSSHINHNQINTCSYKSSKALQLQKLKSAE